MTGCREVPGGRSEASSCPCRHFAAEALGGNDPEADATQSSDPRRQHGIFTRAAVWRNRAQRDVAWSHRRVMRLGGNAAATRETEQVEYLDQRDLAEDPRARLCFSGMAEDQLVHLSHCRRAHQHSGLPGCGPVYSDRSSTHVPKKTTNPKVGGLVWSFQLVLLVSSRRSPTGAPCAAAARKSPGRSCC